MEDEVVCIGTVGFAKAGETSVANKDVMMGSKFSIIVPVYNVASWLRECLDSVLAQTSHDWECICVDDGSTDGSGEILDEYEKKVEKLGGGGQRKLKVIHQKNAGVSAARNVALGVAQGAWIVFVDADDILPVRALEKYSEAIGAVPSADSVRGETSEFVDGSTVDWRTCGNAAITSQDISDQLPYSEVGSSLWGCAMRATMLSDVRFRPYVIGEDRLFVGTFLTHVNVAVRTSEKVYGYRVRRGSAITSPMTVRKECDRLEFTHEWLKVLIASGRRVDAQLYHEIGVSVTETYVTDLGRLPPDTRPEMWRRWWSFLRATRDLRAHFRAWPRFVMWANDVFRCRLLAFATCELPRKIKLLGIHR